MKKNEGYSNSDIRNYYINECKKIISLTFTREVSKGVIDTYNYTTDDCNCLAYTIRRYTSIWNEIILSTTKITITTTTTTTTITT